MEVLNSLRNSTPSQRCSNPPWPQMLLWSPVPLPLPVNHGSPPACSLLSHFKKWRGKEKEVEEKKGSSLQHVLLTGKDFKGLNSILNDCVSLLPIVLRLFYKLSYLDQLRAWDPGGLTPRSSHFLCEHRKFRHRTTWPVDHKLLSQNKFIMPLGKNLYNRHGKSTVFQCCAFSCRNYPVQVVTVHISPAFPNGKGWHINAALPSLQGPFRTPLTDARDQFHYMFFVYNTPSLSTASSPKGPSSTTLVRAAPRQLCPSLPWPAFVPIIFPERPTALFFLGCRYVREEQKLDRYQPALEKEVFALSLLLKTKAQSLRAEEEVERWW